MEPIAIIGTGCRFPGASSTPARLWELLRAPRDISSKVPSERFNIDGFYHPDGGHHGTTNTQESYFLTENVRGFDASFFNISASEAECIDPQQRILLETVYESLEAAGLRLEDLQGSKTGVFCGVMCDDYGHIMMRDIETVPRYAATGTARSIVSNRLSYFFDWHGPSMTIDTACSSSLVAVHLASKALRDGDCRVAVAAGTNLILGPNMYVTESKLNMLSPNGRSRMWDAQADGYARGEGVAAVVLKRLSDAIADGDPIDCIVRATEINQDGRSMGITMPSSQAQTELIRATYAKAGLDVVADRCQYFEAHGTGTPAGDPQEANAIHDAFFPSDEEGGKMHVGSVKTVIGHTEGTAGLAGMIKASLSLQHRVIVPNLHFQSLNPKIAPYYSHLHIPTEAVPWPELPAGVPRRASVNSFGFGGTNAHAILESYEPISLPRNLSSIPVVLPFTFSAATEKTLGSVLESYHQFLQNSPQTDLVDLAWSLFRRRAAFVHRLTLWAPSIESLRSKIEAEIVSRKANNPSTIKSRTTSGPKTILGVFTGQGAQWPEMGMDLITASPEARACLDALQASLDTLPTQYRPDYSLLQELSAPKSSSRLHQAAISQPLCTAVQIVLVNFLRSLGIEFAAVVGHSSGEIGAAYAAGFLTASEAIRIAHLRGVFAKLAGANGQPGAMLAAGMSMEEAEALCARREFAGRVTVAASNSPSSVTLSGDADAIKEVEKLLKDEDKFARALKVDTAYHSHHMLPCSQSYVQALAACNIQPGKATSSKWFSSVYDGQEMTSSHSTVLKADYWNKNMVNAVLFSQALTKAIKSTSFDMIVEVGPHPALKGPALQTISDLLEGNSEIPYTGLLKRGSSGIEAFAEAIGAFWTHLGADSSNVEAYVRQFDRSRQFTFVRGLPPYPFDRTQSYWAESRQSKALTNRTIRPNQVLGAPSPESGEGEWRWRNFLRREEIDWMDGHKVQSQTVFPATGYVAMALEAAAIIAGQRSIRLVEINDLVIKQAIAIGDDSVGVETLFTVQNISSEGDLLSGDFTCFANFGGTLRRCVSGRMTVTFGDQDSMILPPRMSQAQGMTDINLDSFYSYLSKLGYGYTGLFRGITSLLRQKDASTGLIQNACLVDSSSPLLLHPALMDTMLQTLLACVGMPGDGALYTLHIPTKIGRIAINPRFYGPRAVALGENLAFDAAVTKFDSTGVRGDADLFDMDGNGILQMESVEVAPLMAPTAADDRLLFSQLVWGGLHPDAALAYSAPSPNQVSKFDLLERTALLYMKDMQERLTSEERANLDWHRSRVVSWVDRVLTMARAGTHPICRPEWLEDSLERVSPLLDSVADDKDDIDIAVMHVVGKNILRFVRGETTILEELRRDNLLDRLYKESDDMAAFNAQLGDVADQIAFRYPRMKILEIGGGTGSATKAVIDRIGRSYHSYTFTDISVGFFEEAQEAFADHADRFIYKALDVERDPLEQGFEKEEYDMIVAANVLHATKSMKTTMTNVRSLLKPGGHLVLLEGTNLDVLRTTFVFSGFEGWWLGEPDGRLWGPMMNEREWDTLLKNVGFSGVDTITPEHEVGVRAFSVVVSQAVNDQIRYLRDPLDSTITEPKHNDLFIIGGATDRTSSLVTELEEKLAPFFRRLIRSETLESVNSHNSSMATVLNLTDLDSPCFKDFTSDRLDALKGLVDASRHFLWITAGSDGENPYQSMGKGMLRCLGFENPHSRYQHLNIADWSAVTAPLLATTLLRLAGPDFDNDYNLPAATWSIEPELRLENGVTTIPRVKPDAARNVRYMANRRAIYDTVDLQQSNVQVTLSGDSYDLVPSSQPQAGSTPIRVAHSTLTAVRVKGAFLHLVIGRDVETGAQLLALSSEHASVISTPACWAVPCDVPQADAQEFLAATVSALSAIDLTGLATPGSALLVHEAQAALRTAISIQASSSGIRPFFTTSKPENRSDGVIFLHGMSSTRALAAQLPKGVSATVRFDTESDSVFNRVESLLPATIVRERVGSLYQNSSHVSKSCEVREVGETLHQARLLAAQVASGNMEIDVVDVRDLPGSSADINGLKLVDWANAADAPVRVQPASSQLTLSGDKTYLLIGMTGDLGRSVCQWMVSKGARNIVLASRRPKIEKWWIDSMAKAGAKVVPMVM
jgi:acyl transferase domain-containing protein/SAM-dependent methyltransferase